MNLTDPVTSLPFVGDKYGDKLKKLGITKISDLLTHVPSRYVDFRYVAQIQGLKAGESVTLQGQIVSIQNIFTKKGKLMQLANLSDGENKINIMWFNQPYLTRALYPGLNVSVSGKVSFWQKKLVIFSPQYEIVRDNTPTDKGGLIPIYPETEGISSKWLKARLNYLLKRIDELDIEEFLLSDYLEEQKLKPLTQAIANIHKPLGPEDASSGRDRLAFNELLEVQLSNNLKKIEWQKVTQSHPLKFAKKDLDTFYKNLPFELTPSQTRSVDEIAEDLKKVVPMNRLLEGDVGSGKTAVAAAAAFLAFINGHQTVFMAPTQILAEQHFKTLQSLLKPYNMRIALVTGGKSEVGYGKADLIIGTTALVYNRIDFDNVALVVIDEQHRFGVHQRAKLADKASGKKFPNILTMTATPIPRTIALTLYGDLDLSTLDELPKGRQKIVTWIVASPKRKKAYEWIRNQVQTEQAQVFVVCPLIEESEDEKMAEVKAASAEHAKLKKVFPKLRLGLLHGRLKAKEKTEILNKFKAGKIDILVSTPVIEVGIDVPSATIMMIESAERFGLSQLHQLRGRVGRGEKKSYCLLLPEGKGGKAVSRLEAIKSAKTGRELAEIDLKLRGAGEIFGVKQHGIGDLKIASWQDIDLIKKSRELALKIAADPRKYKNIMAYFKKKQIADN